MPQKSSTSKTNATCNRLIIGNNTTLRMPSVIVGRCETDCTNITGTDNDELFNISDVEIYTLSESLGEIYLKHGLFANFDMLQTHREERLQNALLLSFGCGIRKQTHSIQSQVIFKREILHKKDFLNMTRYCIQNVLKSDQQ